MKRTDAELEKLAIERYSSGESMKSVAVEIGVTPATVLRILRAYGIQSRSKGGLYPLDESYIIQAYKEGQSASMIAAKFDVTMNTITAILEKHGIARNNRYKNTTFDTAYFNVLDRCDKAYFLGFLIADGYVARDSNHVRISLAAKDVQILELFRQVTKNANPLYHRKDQDQYSFNVRSKQWKHDLARYGCVPCKTFISYLPLIDDAMMPHMIRGLIDGDGWVSSKSHQVGFCGTKEIVTGMRDYLHTKLNVWHVKVLEVKPNTLWQITWASKRDIQKLFDYLYKDSGPYFLTRKYDQFKLILQGNTEVSRQITQG